jgi:GNAT superfamily N-acetyltransferase
MTSSIKITPLHPDDFENAVNLVLKFAEEEFDHAYDIKAIATSIAHFMAKHPSMAIRDGEKLVGVFIIGENSVWWDSKPHLYNVIAYLEPEYRGKGLFKRLMANAEKYASMVGMDFVPGLMLVHNVPSKCKAFERMGYNVSGAFFTKKAG